MNRPSHWLLVFFVVIGGLLWGTGQIGRFLDARPAATKPVDGEPTSVVVRRVGHRAPKATNSVLIGRVVDRLGWPVVGAIVGVVGDAAERERTDAEGRFELTVAGAIHKMLRVDAPGRHEPAVVRGSHDELVVVMQDAVPWLRDARLAPDQPLDSLLIGEGFVKDAGGQRLARVRVTVRETGASVFSDQDGRYTVPLPRGTSTLVAYDIDGRVAVSEPMIQARTQGKVPLPDLLLADGLALRGRLVDAAGEPSAGATVVFHNGGVRRQTTTDGGGLFAIGGLVPDDSELEVLPHRGRLAFKKLLSIAADVDLGEVPFLRAQREPLRLRVVDEERQPVSHVHVVANQLGLRRAYGQANDRGEVVLAGLTEDHLAFEIREENFSLLNFVAWDANERAIVVTP